MATDRELFIQQLVAALQENDALSGGASALPPPPPPSGSAGSGGASSRGALGPEQAVDEHTGFFLRPSSSAAAGNSSERRRLAREAHAQLQFDFPQVREPQLEALAELYRAVGGESRLEPELPITATLLDGIAYLNQQSSSGGPSGSKKTQNSEASGLLAAAVLLVVVRACLEAPDGSSANALLTSLVVTPQPQPQQQHSQPLATVADGFKAVDDDGDGWEEEFAVQEDPDDLSEVYEGQLPVAKAAPRFGRQQQATALATATATATASRVDKLRFLASRTFSSSFAAVSMEKWEQWRLDDELVAVMRLLMAQPAEDDGQQKQEEESESSAPALYGPRGEWSRYLYVLRDRVLRFPVASRHALWRLKELVEFLQQRQAPSSAATQLSAQPPQHLVYRVLAELAISREFQQRAAQRAQQGLALAIQELLPLINQEVQQLAATESTSTAPTSSVELLDADGDEELAVVLLQLLHFLLFASPNARTTAEKLQESGLLRTLLTLLPAAAANRGANDQQLEAKRWFPLLLRLLGECALWHSGFAAYVARVPKLAALLPTLRERFVAEELLLALAFRQHQVQLSASFASSSAAGGVWEAFASPSLFAEQCASYLEAMKKDAVFVLDCVAKALPAARSPVRQELQRSLQQVYGRFARAFEYPTFAADEAARQQQAAQTRGQSEEGAGEPKGGRREHEDRGQAEALQFTALRNKLRQSVKTLLLALAAGPATAGGVSSKLD
ncbi:hypothetical protein BBJ28_00018219 [Nothophytophthora sp. Chile5]|nr:hypothetical protein BBJ28_00018219 [Nothophytophthora sp. Chile5]